MTNIYLAADKNSKDDQNFYEVNFDQNENFKNKSVINFWNSHLKIWNGFWNWFKELILRFLEHVICVIRWFLVLDFLKEFQFSRFSSELFLDWTSGLMKRNYAKKAINPNVGPKSRVILITLESAEMAQRT